MNKNNIKGYLAIIAYFVIILVVGFSLNNKEETDKKDDTVIVEKEEKVEKKEHEEKKENEEKIDASVILDISKIGGIDNSSSNITGGPITDDNGYLKEGYNIEELSGQKVVSVVEPLYSETGLGNLIILTAYGKVYFFSGVCRMGILNDFEVEDDCVEPKSFDFFVDKISSYKVYDYLNSMYYSKIMYYSGSNVYDYEGNEINSSKELVFGQSSYGLNVYKDNSITFNNNNLKDGEKELDCAYLIKTTDYYVDLFYIITKDNDLYTLEIDDDKIESLSNRGKVVDYNKADGLKISLQDDKIINFMVEK